MVDVVDHALEVLDLDVSVFLRHRFTSGMKKSMRPLVATTTPATINETS